MAYYLTIEAKKGTYTPVNIVKSSGFVRLSNLKGNGVTLQEIDTFTTQFYNEVELRELLLKEQLIANNCIDKPLTIRKLYQGKYIKVMYDMLYQKDIEYIMNPKKIIEKVNSFLLNGDYRFVEKYANHYMEYRECSSTAPEVRELAKTGTRLGYAPSYLCAPDENGDKPLVRMTKLLIYDYYQGSSGRVEYKDTIKYRNLHSVIAFVNNYEKTCSSEDDKVTIKNEESKKRTRKKEPIDGQYSLF